MPSTLRLIVVLVIVSQSGCVNSKPRLPSPIANKVIPNRVAKLETLVDDYDASIAKPDLPKAKLDRNELVFQLLALIDDSYDTFESDLFVGRASGNFAADFTELSVSAVTGITNGARVKSILAIALTGFKGARKAFDANFFRERTTEIIALKMRASRAKVLQTIHQGMALGVDEYPLGAALDDVINYYHAGSVNNALLELSQDTGEDAKQSRETAAEFKISPFLTRDEAKDYRDIRQAAEKIHSRLFSPDENTRSAAQKDLASVLNQLYDTRELEGKSREQLFDMLNTKIAEARTKSDQTLRKKILAALKPPTR